MDLTLDEIIEPFAAKFILENQKVGALGLQDINEAYHQGFVDGIVYLASNTINQLGTCGKENEYTLKLINRQWWLVHKASGSKNLLASFLFNFQPLPEIDTELQCGHTELVDTGTGYFLCPSCLKKSPK